MALNQYLQVVQGLVRDRSERELNPEDLRVYVNLARREVAMRSQCIRILSPSSGAVGTVTMTKVGSGYTNPTVTISAPDAPGGQLLNPSGLQATAIAIVANGCVASISVTNGGSGYFQPTVSITDPTGTGATAVANVVNIFTTQGFQEEYTFSQVPTGLFPGVDSVFAVLRVNMIYANYRYGLPRYSFGTYQNFVRQYPNQYYYVPTIMTQRAQGTQGSLLFYPIPSTAYRWEWDCLCLPVDLADDQTVEAIPQPWQDAVIYRAASLAYEELQNLNAARYYAMRFEEYSHKYSSYARPGGSVNPYGRY